MIFLLSCEPRYSKFNFCFVLLFDVFLFTNYDYVKCFGFQILDWLSHSPTDIESYIRPGCIILTIYLHQAEAAWEEVSFINPDHCY